MTSSAFRVSQITKVLNEANVTKSPTKEVNIMRRRMNPVQVFIRNFIRLIVFVPLWLLFALPDFRSVWIGMEWFEGGSLLGTLSLGIIKTLVILWIANTLARMFYVLPEWERLVLLRLGKSVGARGPGFFIIPPFIYSVARIIDIRISTYEVKATKTLTMDNIPVDINKQTNNTQIKIFFIFLPFRVL